MTETTTTTENKAEEFKIQLPTGEVYEGKDWKDVAEKVAKAKQDTADAYKTEKQQREELEAQIEAAKPKPQPQQGEIDYTPYWALVNSGKMIEASNWLDAKRFGFDTPEEVVPTLTGAVRKTNELSDMVEIERFKMANPDFPATAEASDALMSTIKQWNVPWDSRTLTAAYKTLVTEGKVKPVEEKKTDLGGAPPPGVTVGSGAITPATNAELEEFQKLPLDKMEEELRKKGLMR